MLRWLVVCALLAQTLALPRPDRHAWPNWMQMPKMDQPDWMRMPTKDDFPDVTIPDIHLPELPTLPQVDIPDIQIPDIDMQMPDTAQEAFQWWNPSRSSGSNGGQRVQSSNGRGRGQGISDRRPQQPTSNGRWHWSWQDSNNQQGSTGRGRPDSVSDRQPNWQEPDERGSSKRREQRPVQPQTGRGRPDQDRQPTRQDPQRGSSIGRGQRPVQPQTGRGRPDQDRQPTRQEPEQGSSKRRGQRPVQPQTGRGRPDQDRQPTRQEPEQGSSKRREQRPVQPKTGRGRPDQDRQPTRQNPQRGSSIGRGQQQKPSRPEQQRPSQTNSRRPIKERKQRPQSREGPPQRQEPIRKYPKTRRPSTNVHVTTQHRSEPSVGQQVEQFRSGMPTWLRDELNDTFTTMRHEIDEGRLLMDSWVEDIRTAAGEWWDRWNGRTNTDSRRPTTHRDHDQHGSRFGDSGRQNGQSRYPYKGRKDQGDGSWFNTTTTCRRPFRPQFERPSREEPVYTVLCGGNDYEARLYNASVWVSVTVKALTYDLAVHKAYMKLYRYINGHNSHGAEVTRTVPVHTKVKSNARQNRWFERHNYTISFYLPEDVHVDPPTPNDPQLFIEREEPTVYYAHTFRGYALEFNIWEYLEELTDTLAISQEAYRTEDYIVNVYDAPWRFFNRRNEILVAMDTNLLEVPWCTIPKNEPLVTSKPETTSESTETISESSETTSESSEAAAATTTGAPHTTGIISETTSEATTEGATTKEPTIIGEIPAEIILPGIKNPFENNDLEQDKGADCKQGTECPRSETAVAYDGFELRHYAYSRWVCLDQAACNLEDAQKSTQGHLLTYFYSEGNREKVAMQATTPLVIGMDVSDLNRTDCGKIYTSCLFIPEEHQGAPPTPRDARLYIQDIPAMSRYVMPFTGFATSQNVPKFGVEFLMTLENTKLPYDGSIVAVAQYTTSKLAKTRLNELWVMDKSLIQGNLKLE